MALNSEQQELKERIQNFILSDKKGCFGIYGAGGTGKTYTICQSINKFKGKVLFLGATNKVCTVLKDGLSRANYDKPQVKTIDSFLKFKIKKDHENKSNIHYTFPTGKSIPDLIIIDEVSMITAQKFELIERLKVMCKIILIGDYLQLPPIEESKENMVRNKDGFLVSKIFTAIPENDCFTLTIQNRQKEGTDLSNLVTGFRNHMMLKIDPIKLAEKKNNARDLLYYYTNDPELKQKIKESDCVAVCYKNLSVLNFNWLIGSTKSMKKDYRLNEINIGDKLMFDQFYFHKEGRTETSFYTSNIVQVLSIKKSLREIFTIKDTIKKTITFDLLEVQDYEGNIKEVRYIKGGLYGVNGGGVSQSVYGQRKTYSEHIQKGKNVQENKEFLTDLNTRFSNYQNSFAKLKRPYAITAHKAQGSTYDTVIIPVYDYYSMNYKDANQLLYVALSRAKNRIIFVNKKIQFDDNGKRKMFTEFEKNSIASNQDYKCKNWKCKADLVDREFDIDHEVPLSLGGKNSIENLQALCKKCHKIKTAYERAN
jgi:hypothetical protein